MSRRFAGARVKELALATRGRLRRPKRRHGHCTDGTDRCRRASMMAVRHRYLLRSCVSFQNLGQITRALTVGRCALIGMVQKLRHKKQSIGACSTQGRLRLCLGAVMLSCGFCSCSFLEPIWKDLNYFFSPFSFLTVSKGSNKVN